MLEPVGNNVFRVVAGNVKVTFIVTEGLNVIKKFEGVKND